MRHLARILSTGLVLALGAGTAAAQSGKEISVEPSAVFKGESVHLRWYFTGDKVTISGGRFGKGTVVTGKSYISDKPTATTTYTFDVQYKGLDTDSTGKQVMKPLQARYTATVRVLPAAPVATYKDSRGFTLNVPQGWKRDNVNLPDPANNALMYFQKEDDSVERISIAILPSAEMDAATLMQKVERSLYGSYEQVEILQNAEAKVAETPALLKVYVGKPTSHPGTKTQTICMAFVQDGRAYVVSARTFAKDFEARRPLLERMVRSFAPPASKSASSK
jgi:hypothetical protein